MYQQMKDYLRHAEQRAFWLFSYANVAGLVLGVIAARWLTTNIVPGLPGPLVYLVCLGIGLAATWPREGRPVYRLVLLWSWWRVRHQLAPAQLIVHGATFYRVPPVAVRPMQLAGLLVYHGDTPQTGA